MEFAILGPIVVRRDGHELPLGGPKQRVLLAMLLLRANEVVPRDRLIDGIWGERPPPTAAHTLDNYISRLRKALGDGRLSRRPPGYLVRVEEDELDLERFERLLQRAREDLARGAASRAAEDLRSALALWRGPALADIRYEPFAHEEAERLEERRLQALEARVEADLALGRSSELVPELEAAVREHPFRERLLAQLMLALYRAGRQGESLAVFQAGRQRLAHELGLEPGPELRDLERRILAQDPGLAAPPAVTAPRSLRAGARNRTGRVVAGLATLAVAATAVIGILLGTGEPGGPAAGSRASQIVGLSLRPGTEPVGVNLGRAPAASAAGYGALWLAAPSDGAVLRVDLSTHAVVDSVPLGGAPAAVAVGSGSVWAASALGDAVERIDPRAGVVAQRIPLGDARVAALAFGSGRLWIADSTGDSLIEVDPKAGQVRRRIPLHVRPSALAIGSAAVWVADYANSSVAEVDMRTGGTLATIRVGGGPSSVAVGAGAVWAANALDATVSRIDPNSGSVTATVPVGSGPRALAVAGDAVWVANEHSASVSRIDPAGNAVVDTLSVAGRPTALSITGERVWVSLRPLMHRRGGTLTLLHTRPITLDPALQVDLLPLQADGLTRDGLVTYNHVPGPAGTQLVPDLAITVPAPTDGGTTYTFRLRPGIRYSDGRPLRAADFRRAIERAFRLHAEGMAAFEGIVGADACATRCDLSDGIVADEAARTVTFRLRSPDPDFLASLAWPQAAPVPPGTPAHDLGLTAVPGTGPYRVASASRRAIRYVRNRFFREWSHAAQPDGNPDEIVMRFGRSPGEAIRSVEQGRADWSADNIPADMLQRLKARYPSRLHSFSIPTTDFVQFNTTLPPFDDIRARRALNYALDRRKIALMYGGPDLASPTCQVLPPGLAGYRRYCPYTTGLRRGGDWTAPDLERAKRLVAASGTRGQRVTVWGWTDDPTISPQVVRHIAATLHRLGYRTRVKLVPHAYLARAPARVFRSIQLIPAAWGDTPQGMFATWFACDGPNVHGWFCDRRLDRLMRRARTIRATRPREAAALWALIDRDLVDQAAWAPLISEHALDLVSERVGNYQAHPYWGLIASQLWLR